MGCRQTQGIIHMPLYNMVVVGFSGCGKTKIISQLKGQETMSNSSQLNITTFIVNNQIKILTFEVAGKAYQTWQHYYPTANIVLFVIDLINIMNEQKYHQIIHQIDKQISQKCKLIILFNKTDLLINQSISNKNKIVNKNDNDIVQRLGDNCESSLIQRLQVHQLTHEVITCKCSAKTGQGIKSLIRKIVSFVV